MLILATETGLKPFATEAFQKSGVSEPWQAGLHTDFELNSCHSLIDRESVRIMCRHFERERERERERDVAGAESTVWNVRTKTCTKFYIFYSCILHVTAAFYMLYILGGRHDTNTMTYCLVQSVCL